MSEQPQQPRKPKGTPLNLSDAAIDDAAEIKPVDIENARDWFQRRVREGGQAQFANLLDARDEDDPA